MSLLKHSSALALAGIVEYAAQLMLPVVLVRYLTVSEFSEYRLVWLLAGTALAIFPFFMPGSLFYFFSRSPAAGRARLIGNTSLFLIMAGSLAGFTLWRAAPWLGEALASVIGTHVSVPVFVGLWVMGSLFDTVAAADGRAVLQAQAIIVLALVRTVVLSAAVICGGDIGSLLLAMCSFAAVKFALAAGYGLKVREKKAAWWDWALFRRQLVYSTPFAVGNALFLLRGQADQWVVASIFPTEVFALISIGAVVLGIASLVKVPMRNAILPPLGRLLTAGDLPRAAELVAKGNAAMIMLLLPFLGGVFVSAPELVSLIYTDKYLQAAPLMQLYIVGLGLSIAGGGHLLVAFNAGRVAMVISAVNLLLSILFSYAGATLVGLHGVVAGSIASLFVGEYWALNEIARRLGCTVWRLFDIGFAVRIYGATIVASAVALAGGHCWGGGTVWRLLGVGASYLLMMVLFFFVLRMYRSTRALIVQLRQPLPGDE